MKKLVAITVPEILPEEGKMLRQLCEEGIDYIHLRKPGAKPEEIAGILREIPEYDHPKITLHDGFGIIGSFPHIGGIHLNSRNPESPANFRGRISRSFHSLEELAQKDRYSYVFLSPIFNSISKSGYLSNFPAGLLQQAAATGCLSEKVFALGGISRQTIPRLQGLPFGGVAVLGGLWGEKPSAQDMPAIIKRLKTLQLCVQQL